MHLLRLPNDRLYARRFGDFYLCTECNLLLSDLFHVFSSSLLTAHGEIVPHCRALQTPSAVRPPGRLIASIVLVLRSAQREGGSSLCGITIVSTPPFLLHQCCPSSLQTVSPRPHHKGPSQFPTFSITVYVLSQNSSRNALIAHRKSEQDFTPLATTISATPQDVSIIDIRNASNQ